MKSNFVEEFIGKRVSSALSFDISKTSTGVSIFRNGMLKTFTLKTEPNEYSGMFGLGKRLTEFEQIITDACNGDTHFDIICVEEAITGVNHKTNFIAMVLNGHVDYMISSRQLTCDKFYRVGNTSWKKTLRELSGVKTEPRGKDYQKKTVIKCFQALGFPLSFAVDKYSSWSAYMRSGVQDVLDSVGILMDSAIKYESTASESPVYDVKVKYKVADNKESLTKRLKVPLVDNTDSEIDGLELLNFYNELQFSDEVTSDCAYLFHLKSLGKFGSSMSIYDFYEDYYVLITANVKEVE